MTDDIANVITHKDCPICGIQAQLFPIIGDHEHYTCPECGECKISGSALTALTSNPLNEQERNRVSEAIRSLPREGGPPLILTEFIETVRKELLTEQGAS